MKQAKGPEEESRRRRDGEAREWEAERQRGLHRDKETDGGCEKGTQQEKERDKERERTVSSKQYQVILPCKQPRVREKADQVKLQDHNLSKRKRKKSYKKIEQQF